MFYQVLIALLLQVILDNSHLNPEIDPELKAYREKSSAKSSESMKYIPLEQWAKSKINDEEYKKHNKYENNPLLALQEVKDILETSTVIKSSESYKLQHFDEESFALFNRSIPAYVCSVLIENHLDELSVEDKSFCKDLITVDVSRMSFTS
jgi:hypothetical protein